MADDLKTSMGIAASGLKAQSARMKIVAQNIANSDSVSTEPGGKPYARKTITFKNVMDKQLGAEVVTVDKIGRNEENFQRLYDPGHPAADANGYILRTNVSRIIESADLQEAQRSYEANLATIDITKSMLTRTLEILR